VDPGGGQREFLAPDALHFAYPGGSFRTWFCWELFFDLFEREAA
jgi:hypothetical protein